MRALIQRVSSASVTVDSRVIGEIGAGFLVFVCVMRDDMEAESIWLARKVVNLRIFEDEQGRKVSEAQFEKGVLMRETHFKDGKVASK